MKEYLFSQHDPRWADLRIGYGTQTFKQVGCLVCCVAGMLVLAGNEELDPAVLNRWLMRAGGFIGNRFVFGSIRPWGVDLEEVIDCYSVPAPMDRAQETLDAEGWVLAEVDFKPWTYLVDQHWVRVIEVYENDCLIADPWLPPGYGTRRLMPAYARAEWENPARAIFRLALYRPAEGERRGETRWVQRRWPRFNRKRIA